MHIRIATWLTRLTRLTRLTCLTSLLLAALSGSLTVGCNGTDQTANFVGTWAASAGKASTTCPGGAPIADLDLVATGLTLTITATGPQRLQLQSMAGSSCNLAYSVAGNLATADAGQSCSGGGISLAVSSSTLTLSGNTLAVTYNASTTIGGSACTSTYTGATATRR